MNILVTGGNGQLGQCLQLASQGATDSYLFTDVTGDGVQLDITDPIAIERLVAQNDIRCIVNCAAWTNVDAAETNATLAEQLNAAAPEYLATAMKAVNGLLIHISTDYVFGREKYNTPCGEDYHGTPTGIYGATKLRGEQRLIATGVHHLILRTAWLYSEYGKNFVTTMLRLMSLRERLTVVFDQCGTPTYAPDLARTIVHILSNRLYEGRSGIYNFSNEGVCSWYDFAIAIAQYSGSPCTIVPCHSDEYPSPVVRPSYSVLDKTKIKRTFNITIPHWTVSLQQCIHHLTL